MMVKHMILEIIRYPDQFLRQKSEPILEMTAELRGFFDDLAETMLLKDGVGLAAVQVGRLVDIFVLNNEGPQFFVNAKIIHRSAEMVKDNEGCMSLPGMFAKVERNKVIKVAYQDLDMNHHEITLDGLMSRAAQHEQNHCQGILYIDHLSHLKRQMLLKKFSNIFDS